MEHSAESTEHSVRETEHSYYREIEFDDGHKPGAALNETRLAVYSEDSSDKQFVTVFDGLLDGDWAQKTYQYSLIKKKPWGVYIPTVDALNPLLLAEDIWTVEPERAIALVATRELIFSRGKGVIGADVDRIAGTAVWCLPSDVGDSVQYHIDYAELYRYETSVICPPLYAGTYHVTPFGDRGISGGDFMVNVGGIRHYEKFGYKGRKSSAAALADDIAHSSDWIKVPYRFNRGIIHGGDLPHMSTPVTSIRPVNTAKETLLSPPSASSSSSSSSSPVEGDRKREGEGSIGREEENDGEKKGEREGEKEPMPHTMKRVILGFNCFPLAAGEGLDECCRRAPEHSDAFNRTIKLYQTMAALSGGNKTGGGSSNHTGDYHSISSLLSLPQEQEDQQGQLGASGLTPNYDPNYCPYKFRPYIDPADTTLPVPKGGLCAKDVLKNPALGKMLVLAARKVREQREREMSGV